MGRMAVIEQLNDDLVLRTTTSADSGRMAQFQARWQSEEGPDKPEEQVGFWVEDLYRGDHPTFRPEHGTVVENRATAEIVSGALLIPQTWNLDGVSFGVGRPELIATHAGYRRRGLIRRQLETLHGISAQLGHSMQTIVGIPWFYRQFGYEMTLGFGGGRRAYSADRPPEEADSPSLYRLRPAVVADAPFLAETYAYHQSDRLIYCERDVAIFEYDIAGRDSRSTVDLAISILENRSGQSIAYVAYEQLIKAQELEISYLGLAYGQDWQAVGAGLLQATWQLAEQLKTLNQDPINALKFGIGPDHPFFTTEGHRFQNSLLPYSWYLRVPDLPGFLSRLAPVFQARLTQSPFAKLTRNLSLDFYTNGLELNFQNGQLNSCTPWHTKFGERGDVRMPDHSFLHLVSGTKSFDEVRDFYADCYPRNNQVANLLKVLFPKKTSGFWGLV